METSRVTLPSVLHSDPLQPPLLGVIWHLSDLHLSLTESFGAADIKAAPHDGRRGDFDTEVFRPLLEFAAKRKADWLVVSGDFVDNDSLKRAEHHRPDTPPTRTAREEVFARAAGLIRELAQALGLGDRLDSRVVVCAGNHDVDRAVAGEEPEQSRRMLYREMAEFLRPDRDPPYVAESGLTVLALDTAFLGGTFFKPSDSDAEATRYDAPAYSCDDIACHIASLSRPKPGVAAETNNTLGVVVAHHPPALTPTARVEVKEFEVAIAGAQAKTALHRAGFRIVLHGHKHMALVHEEHVHLVAESASEAFLVIGARNFANGEGGFNIIEYAVSPGSGEARVRVEPYRVGQYVPSGSHSHCFTIASPRLARAAVIRIQETITAVGDSCTDIAFTDIPVPTRDREEGGWTKEGGGWVRHFARMERVDHARASRPNVLSLVQGVTAESVDLPVGHADATRAFNIRVSVEADRHVTHASFVQRTWTNSAYAVSRLHQQRLWGTDDRWERLVHYVRDPADRLEFHVTLPFALAGTEDIRVATYVKGDRGVRRRHDAMLRFCSRSVHYNRFTRTVTVTIERPLVGVGYAVEWKLPEGEMSGRNGARKLRFYEHDRQEAAWVGSQLRRTAHNSRCSYRAHLSRGIEAIIEGLYPANAARRSDEIEWSLFVPIQSVAGDTHPSLWTLYASYPDTDPRWIPEWPVRYGVVGRAYALNSTIRGGTRFSLSSVRPEGAGWAKPDVDVYVPRPGTGRPHSVLYALPIPSPRRPQADLTWAVLCLGTRQPSPALNLDVNVGLSKVMPGPRKLDGAAAVVSGMNALSWGLFNELLGPQPASAR